MAYGIRFKALVYLKYVTVYDSVQRACFIFREWSFYSRDWSFDWPSLQLHGPEK